MTLKPAFAERDQARLIQQIIDEAPIPLRQHDRRIPRDLETLVLKALAKVPEDRFVSAAALADELRRYMEGRPTLTRPLGPAARFWRWCKRSPGLAAASILAALLTTTLVIGLTAAAWIFRAQDRQTRENLFDSLTAQAQARRFSKRVGQRFASLDALSRAVAIARDLKLPADRLDPLRDDAIASLALPDLKATGRVIARPAGAFLVTFDSTMARYALRFAERVEVHRVADDAEIARFAVKGNREIDVFGFSPDGRYLASTNLISGNRLTVTRGRRRARLVAMQRSRADLGWTGAARFSPDSRRIAFCRANGKFIVREIGEDHRFASWLVPSSTDIAYRFDGAQIAAPCTTHAGESSRCLIMRG